VARVFRSANAWAGRVGIATAVAVVLVATVATSGWLGAAHSVTPHLTMINGDGRTVPLGDPLALDPVTADPSPTTTDGVPATGPGGGGGSGGGGGPGPASNGVPPGAWQYAEGGGPVFGSGGGMYAYRVAVETGVPVSVGEFTSTVDSALGDYRSWPAAGNVQLVRVPGGSPSNFTVLLAMPWTAYSLCLAIGIDIRVGGVPYTSCQAGANIVINADRYLGGVGGYGASLGVYRQYAINHEVGHRLGHGHVFCPGPGQPAPVMQQQTLGLQGCVANAWPYPGAPAPPPPPEPEPTTAPPTPTPTPTPSLTPTPGPAPTTAAPTTAAPTTAAPTTPPAPA
jgi:uncharacterized protein DUF3152